MRRIVREPTLQNSVDANERDVYGKTTTFDDVRVPASDFKTGLDDMRPLNCCSGNEFKTTGQDGDCCSNALLDLSTNGGILGKPENKEHNGFSLFLVTIFFLLLIPKFMKKKRKKKSQNDIVLAHLTATGN